MDSGHCLEELTDEDGWDVAVCDCGWKSPPSPDKETAAEFWANHAVVSGRWAGLVSPDKLPTT